jgi:hypothetical protein
MCMTLPEIHRMIRAAIRAARQEGAPEVEVKIGDETIVRIPLSPKSPSAGNCGEQSGAELTPLDAWVAKHAR